jgi:hypothetical protein
MVMSIGKIDNGKSLDQKKPWKGDEEDHENTDQSSSSAQRTKTQATNTSCGRSSLAHIRPPAHDRIVRKVAKFDTGAARQVDVGRRKRIVYL